MPDLEAKIASFAEKLPSKQEARRGKEAVAKTSQPSVKEEQQGISGMVKGWFWGKK